MNSSHCLQHDNNILTGEKLAFHHKIQTLYLTSSITEAESLGTALRLKNTRLENTRKLPAYYSFHFFKKNL